MTDILTLGQARKVVKRGTDLTDAELRAKLADHGAVFTGKGRSGVQIPVAALNALDLIPEGADIDALLSEAPKTGGTRGPRTSTSTAGGDVVEAKAKVESLRKDEGRAKQHLSAIRSEIRDLEKFIKREHSQAVKRAEQAKAEAEAVLAALGAE